MREFLNCSIKKKKEAMELMASRLEEHQTLITEQEESRKSKSFQSTIVSQKQKRKMNSTQHNKKTYTKNNKKNVKKNNKTNSKKNKKKKN